ncbi:MAG: hypothetical protein AAFZ38_08310 [Myxococcota bacterium]
MPVEDLAPRRFPASVLSSPRSRTAVMLLASFARYGIDAEAIGNAKTMSVPPDLFLPIAIG